jgi:hypothetical protein
VGHRASALPKTQSDELREFVVCAAMSGDGSSSRDDISPPPVQQFRNRDFGFHQSVE